MNKIGKFWLFGKQDEPAEDFDVDYDNIYYEDRPTSNPSDELSDDSVEKMSAFGGDAYSNTYAADASEVKVVKEEPVVEEEEEIEEEPLYKVVFAPETYRDSAEIVECFKMGRVVVIDTAELAREDFLRMLDYVMGAVHALDGQLVRLSKEEVALFPADVDTEIDIDEIEDEPEDYFDEADDGEEDNA